MINTLQVSLIIPHLKLVTTSLPQPKPEIQDASSPGDSLNPLQHHEALGSRASSLLDSAPDTQELVQRMLQYQQQGHYSLPQSSYPVDQDQVRDLACLLVLSLTPGLASSPPPPPAASGAPGLLLGLHGHPARQAPPGWRGVAAAVSSSYPGEY